MKTAAEYRAMAEECFQWAREAKANEVRVSLLQLAQVWLDAASKLDGLPTTARSADWQATASAKDCNAGIARRATCRDQARPQKTDSRFGLFHRDPHRIAGIFPVTILN